MSTGEQETLGLFQNPMGVDGGANGAWVAIGAIGCDAPPAMLAMKGTTKQRETRMTQPVLRSRRRREPSESCLLISYTSFRTDSRLMRCD